MATHSGKEFERLIEALFMLIGSDVRNTDPPVRILSPQGKNGFRGMFSEKGCLDFEGGVFGRFCAYDAKTCSGKRFSMRRIEGHQLDRMKEIDTHGCPTGVFLQYEADETGRPFICLVPYRTIRALLDDGERSLLMSTARALLDPELENRIYRLDRFDYDLFFAALVSEFAYKDDQFRGFWKQISHGERPDPDSVPTQ